MSNRSRILFASLLCMLILANAPGVHGQGRDGGRRPGQEVRGPIKSIDATSITLTFSAGRDAAPTEKTYALAKDVEICTGIGGFRFGGAFKEAKRADLSEGVLVALVLSADQKSVESIVAEEPLVRGQIKAVDAKKKTITVTLQGRGREEAAPEKSYTIAADAEVGIDDGRGRRFSIREGKLDDLSEGAIVTLRLSLDKKLVNSIQAEGAMVFGTLKSIDAAKRSLTITTRPARGDDAAEERTVSVAKEAVVTMDDGRGRRLSVKEVKLADLPVGSNVMVRMAVDQTFAMMLRAEGPMLSGMLKGIDAAKNTITIGIPKSRTEFDEKTYTLIKGARVMLDGKETKLGDLKVEDNGPFLQLRLTLDQKSVQSVQARQPGSR
ncbi:MAG: hypothetical protein HYX68_29600 [Planctomycetes bacterium]|nr:hypothetical protein [Planctomycetota bacterium]